MNLRKANIIVMQATICIMGICMIATIWLEQIQEQNPTQQAIKSIAMALLTLGFIILPFGLLIYLCEYLASRHNQMRNQIRSITLVLFSLTVFSISSTHFRYYFRGHEHKKNPNYERIYGIPAFVTIECKALPHPERTNEKTIVDVKQENIILMFIVLSVPTFIAGYIWGNKHHKIPNQRVDPTESGS